MGNPLLMPRYSSLQTCRSWIWEQVTRSSQAAILSTPQLLTNIRHLVWAVRGPSASRFNAQTSRQFRIHLILCYREQVTHLLPKLSLSCHLDVFFLSFSKVFFLAILNTMKLMTSCSKVPFRNILIDQNILNLELLS